MIISISCNVVVLTYIIVFGVDWSSSCKSANKFLMTKATVALLAAVMSASVWRAYNGIRYAFYVLSSWCVKSKEEILIMPYKLDIHIPLLELLLINLDIWKKSLQIGICGKINFLWSVWRHWHRCFCQHRFRFPSPIGYCP